MRAIPLELKEAQEYIRKYHRHHEPAHRDKFRIGCEESGKLIGVIQVGRPVSRYLDDGKTLEVLRMCTRGERNACSFLYSRAARIAKEMGYQRIITYILESEDGTSLKAAGWKVDKRETGGGSWDTPSRRRTLEVEQLSLFGEPRKKYPTDRKQRWVKELKVMHD